MDHRRFITEYTSSCVVVEEQTSSFQTSSKRKRRSTLDAKDIDNHEYDTKRSKFIESSSTSNDSYIKRHISDSSSDKSTTPLPSPLGTDLISESDSAVETSSRERLSSLDRDVDYDSPGRQFDGASSPTLSCHSNCNDCNCDNSWHTRGDVTPHGKQPCRRLRHPFSPDSGLHCCIKPTAELRPCPLPALSWANALDVWKVMCHKDEMACLNRSANMFEDHPGLQPRMRTILLDWLIEVCEVYKLHRETYYLAVDYLDRYLSSNKNIQKTHLQLIGITCLFVAAKVEEIYPPKIGEFAYVTDGACQEEDILQQELLLLKSLDWNISPVTILGWLGVYMQLNVSNRTPSSFSNREIKANSQPLSHIKYSGSSVNINRNPKCTSGAGGAVYVSSRDCIASTSSSSGTSSSRNISRNSCKRKLDDLQSSEGAGSSSSRDCIDEKVPRTDDGSDSVSANLKEKENLDDSFIYPQFSGMEFVQTAQLLDLCTLDLGIANYPYSVIAAAAMSHTFTREIAIRVSGFDWNVIAPCADWMTPFFDVASEDSQHLFLMEQNEQVKSKFGLGHVCPNIVTDDSHIIQTHTTSVDMFERAMVQRDYLLTTLLLKDPEYSPANPPSCPEGLLTPPLSSRKPLEVESEPEVNI